jgi:hypothetical protein
MATIVTPPSSIKVQVGNQQAPIVTTTNSSTTNDILAREIATSSFVQANSAFNKANSANTLAQSAYNAANNAGSSANVVAAFLQANAAFAQANTANNTANNALAKAGGTITGNLTVNGSVSFKSPLSVGNLNISETSTNIYLKSNTINNKPIIIETDGNSNYIGVVSEKLVQLYWTANTIGYNANGNANGPFSKINVNESGLFLSVASTYDPFTETYNELGLSISNTGNVTIDNTLTVLNRITTDTVYAYTVYAYGDITSEGIIYSGGSPVLTSEPIGNAAFLTANASFIQANAANTLAQAAYNAANAAGSSANVVAAFLQANAAFIKANSANVLAQAAFDNSNTKFSSSGGTITGSITINQDASILGNLYILGNTTSINTSSFTVVDSLLTLGVGNYTTDLLDIGFSAHYNAGVNAHTGLIRDAGTKEWMFFEGYTPEVTPNNNIIITDPSFRYANVHANNFKGNVIANNVTINGYNVFSYITNAYTQANSANTLATNSFIQANAANAMAYAAFAKANTGGSGSSSGYLADSIIYANTTGYLSNVSSLQFFASNNTLLTTNLTLTSGSGGLITFPDGTTQTTAATGAATDAFARTQSNAAFIQANAAFEKANTGSGSSSGYQNNSVIFANTTGYLSNTSNLQYYSSNNTLYVSGNVNVSNTFVAFYNPAYTNWLQATGSNTGNAVIFSAVGGDSNVSMLLQSQGTGAIDLAAGSKGVNISNGSSITAITRIAGGSGFTGAIVATISPPTTPGGVQATALASTSALTYGIASAGTGYTLNDVLTVLGGTNTTPLTLTVTGVSGGGVTSVTVANYGGYTVLPTNPVSVSGGTGSGVTFNLSNFTLTTPFTITNAGSGYVEQPTITFGPGGTGAGAYVTVGNNTTIKNLGNITTFATPGSSVLAIVDKNANAGNPTNSNVAFSMIPTQSNFGASYLGFGADAYFGTTGTSATAFQFATSVTSPVSNGAGGIRQFAIAHTASAVNYVQATGATTGNGPTISAQGSDATVNLQLASKGSGSSVLFQINALNAFQVTGTGTVVNRLRAIAAITGQPPILDVVGTDTNASMALLSKGTGAIDLAAGTSGINISNGNTVTVITRSSPGTGYTTVPTIAISAPTTAGGVQATATGTITTSGTPTVTNGGTGYAVGNVLTIVGGTPVSGGATLTVTAVSSGVITAATYTNFAQYTVAPTNPVSVTGGAGSGATFTITLGMSNAFTITNAGSGYVEQPTVTFSGGGGSGAAAYAGIGSSTIIRSLAGGNSTSLDFYTPASITSNIPVLRLRDSPGGDSYPQVSSHSGYGQIIAQGGTNAILKLGANGTGSVYLNTNGTSETNQMRVSHTASAVNYVNITGAVTGGSPVISAQGSDTSAELRLRSKGLFNIRLQNGAANDGLVVDMTSGATLANYVSIAPKVAGTSPVISSLGTDTDIDLTLTPKGTGKVVTTSTLIAGLISGGTF